MAEKKSTDDADSAVQGEGDYKAARAYRRDTEKFIAKKGGQIPQMAKSAEQALSGPEAPELKKAEDKGKSKARR